MSDINKALKQEYKNVSKIMNQKQMGEKREKEARKKYPKSANAVYGHALDKKKSKSDQRSSAHFKKWVRATDGEWDDHN